MLIEKKIIDKIEIIVNFIQVREAIIVERDGSQIAKTFHRYVLNPGDDITNQDPKIQAIANAIWTPEVIQEYLSRQNLNNMANSGSIPE